MGSYTKSTSGTHTARNANGSNSIREKPLVVSNPGRPIQGKKNEISIIDIRRNGIDHSILDDMLVKLQPPDGKEKRMPTLLLYDATGLKLFEEITYLEEYYLTNAEIEVLKTCADRIAGRIQPGSIVIELGSGNLRKVSILLQALDRVGKSFEYYALDLSLPELQRTLSAIPKGTYKNVKCYGLYGTYDDGLEWLRNPENLSKPKCILSLGSSIGNFTRDEAAGFIKGFADSALRPGKGDLMLVGIDACKNPGKVWRAYNDSKGVTEKFILNGLLHANHVLDEDVFHIDEWKYIGEYNEGKGRHQAFYSPARDLSFRNITIKAGERVRVEESYKYSITESTKLWEASGLVEGASWGSSSDEYHIHMLSRPASFFPLQIEGYAANPVPSLLDWENIWATWDAVTLGMLPKDELLSKPIKLRNACIFYLGHIPTFLDMHITRATAGKPTGPSYFWKIFERGIDPDVDNPESCHAHSEIPESWPAVEEILAFQRNVRNMVRGQIDSEATRSNRKLRRAFWIGFEHEIMHLETLLYMLLQSDKTLPPPGIVRPDFDAMARQADLAAVANEWVKVPKQKITIGLDDPEDDSGPERYFGWDNEKPQRSAIVPSFEAKARPITNEEYAHYLEATNKKNLPASWTSDISTNGIPHVDGDSDGDLNKFTGSNGYRNGALTSGQKFCKGKYVRTVFGRIPLSQALHWPVIASYDELAGCAKWMNGRIPTVDEARSIYAYADQMKTEDAEHVLSKTISAVNGHLSNDGVEETPPSRPPTNGLSTAETSPNPRQHFVDLEGCNVGFKHWHPTPVTQNGNRLSGQGNFGGAWEWTSSILEKHKGFAPMSLYPAYTADFFDGKHNIVLGGSWATHPKIAGRRSFVNWYQRNYPYVWASARIVRDI